MTPVHMKEQQGLDISVYCKIGTMCVRGMYVKEMQWEVAREETREREGEVHQVYER